LESHYEEVEVSGDLGSGRGEAKVTLVDRVTEDTTYSSSKYLNILKKQADGSWQTTHDIWNDN
jgi:ketosteroid isomerase-like protein